MIRLKPNQYAQVAPLFAQMGEWNVYVTAVLHQTSPGRVYVDNLDAPQSGFLVSIDRSYLVGNPRNAAFNAALRDELHATLLAGDRVNPADPELVLSVASPQWEPALADMLGDWHWPPIWGRNQHFTFDQPQLNWQTALPAGYTIARLDANLLQAQGKNLPQTIADSIRIGWQNEANFLQHGFGFVALHGEEIACWCLADATVADRCEIGIETAVSHRNRGLATAVTAATVEFCQNNGFRHIGWHCEANNYASSRTAEKVGFVQERAYSDYTFVYDEPRHYAELGRFFFKAQLYEEAADMLEIAIETDEAPPAYVYFLTARAMAHLQEPVAIEYLQEAVAAGFKDWQLLQTLPEFAPYRDDPAFPAPGDDTLNE